MSSAYAISR